MYIIIYILRILSFMYVNIYVYIYIMFLYEPDIFDHTTSPSPSPRMAQAQSWEFRRHPAGYCSSRECLGAKKTVGSAPWEKKNVSWINQGQ